MFKFYKDITFYALLFALVSIPLAGLYGAVVVFGIFGTPVGLLMYSYFHKHEFYGYYNRGFSRRYLILRTWMVNFLVSPVLLLLVFIILKLIGFGALKG
ncbi:hypothetical protein [Leeuwenhoekiella nanhaiensis]|uniref:Uncharacterized protein n=1 Tax=Leeuwenhoekiella nanhaiensis TaxID=1655491 RepID=A0A2G1VR37_9FLAO|nr:hypothetical protein [Leeuwenhoekiella nanhaiensis]PHQ29238.1 hypothetical protein CJ305_11585 [Leeuwenhoekiella nanhaiensis]